MTVANPTNHILWSGIEDIRFFGREDFYLDSRQKSKPSGGL